MTDADKPPPVFEAAPKATPQSFAITEMVTCEECLRANPPTRTNCLYCGAELSIGEYSREQKKTEAPGEPNSSGSADVPSAHEPKASQAVRASRSMRTGRPRSQHHSGGAVNPGFHVVLIAYQAKALAETSFAEIAGLLQLQANDVECAVGLNRPIPMSRTTTLEEGTRLADRLGELGVDIVVLSEDALELDVPTKKIRTLQLSDDGLNATLMSGGPTSIAWNELSLLVTGRFLITRKESEERQGRGRAKPMDSRELFSDEPVVDLYRKSDAVGFRIAANSFDFSCLGNLKAMTAFENLTKLIDLVKTRSPGIEFDDSYRSLRTVLNNVWPLNPQTRAGTWRRRGVGKVGVSTVTTVDNENQFNAYSRLRQQIKSNELEGER